MVLKSTGFLFKISSFLCCFFRSADDFEIPVPSAWVAPRLTAKKFSCPFTRAHFWSLMHSPLLHRRFRVPCAAHLGSNKAQLQRSSQCHVHVLLPDQSLRHPRHLHCAPEHHGERRGASAGQQYRSCGLRCRPHSHRWHLCVTGVFVLFRCVSLPVRSVVSTQLGTLQKLLSIL